jgi:transcriptional regulator with XRE-family HTH domain
LYCPQIIAWKTQFPLFFQSLKKGFTDKEIADVFGVTEQTINNWKTAFPLFFESLKKAKAVCESTFPLPA